MDRCATKPVELQRLRRLLAPPAPKLWCSVRRYAVLMKPVDLPSWQGANHSNTKWYCEDLQRRHGGKDTGS
jgi:hypothetical protein